MYNNCSELPDTMVPTSGVEVNLTYEELGLDPEDTANYEFCGAHMLDEAVGDKEAGTIEYFEAEKNEDGISFVLHGTSPVIITWTDKDRDFGVTLADESAGGNLKVKASAFNNTGADISASIIVAVYNKAGKQLATKMAPLSISNGAKTYVTLQFDIEARNGYTIKAFLVEAGKYTPICESVEF